MMKYAIACSAGTSRIMGRATLTTLVFRLSRSATEIVPCQTSIRRSMLEKLLYLKEGQYAPNHFHWFKTEDIINRGGGNVLIRVYNRLPNEEIDYESDVKVHTDGKSYTGSGRNAGPFETR